MSYNKKVYYFFDPLVESIRPAPVIAMIPFFLMWFGIGEAGKLLLITLGVHIDEWMNKPVYPGSSEYFASGAAVQRDIIPAIGPPYFSANIEDGIALLDSAGRHELEEKHPGAWSRIMARRAFMEDSLGIRLKPEVLPLGNMPAYPPPYLLSPRQVLPMR
jgi:hypothetical protein